MNFLLNILQQLYDKAKFIAYTRYQSVRIFINVKENSECLKSIPSEKRCLAQSICIYRLIAAGLGDRLPVDCEARLVLSSTLADTNRQLNDLKNIVRVTRSRAKAKGGNVAVMRSKKKKLEALSSTGGSRQRRLVKWSVVVNLVVMMVMLVMTWATEPTCCDTYTPFSFHPQLRYINPPPI